MNPSKHDPHRLRPGVLFALLFIGPLIGALLGGLTNAISGKFSPGYFEANLGWEIETNLWRAIIAHGIFQGLLFGLGFAVVFTVVVGIVSKGCATLTHAVRYLAAIFVCALGLWVLGGFIGIGLAALSPEFFRGSFGDVPAEHGAMLRYAWVGGSLIGVQFGGFAALVAGCVAFGTRWRRLVRDAAASTTPPVQPA